MAAYYNENDPICAEWLRRLIAAGHIAPGEVDERDIRDVAPADLIRFTQCHFFAGIGIWSAALRRAGWDDDRPIWTGSCPCQPFSAAGAGEGFADERHLWPHWHWLIENIRPRVVVGEQVAGKDGLGWHDLVSDDLDGIGYSSGAVIVSAAGFGVGWRGSAEARRLERAVCLCPDPMVARHLGAFADWADQSLAFGGFHIRERQYFVAVDDAHGFPGRAGVDGAETGTRSQGERVGRSGLASDDGRLSDADSGACGRDARGADRAQAQGAGGGELERGIGDQSGARGPAGRLPDPAGPRCQGGQDRGPDRGGENEAETLDAGRGPGDEQSERGRAAGRVGDGEREGLERHPGDGDGAPGREPGQARSAAAASDAGRVVNDEGRGRGVGGDALVEGEGGHADRAGTAPRGVADRDGGDAGAGRELAIGEQRSEPQHDGAVGGRDRGGLDRDELSGRGGQDNHRRGDLEWLLCRDGHWRPTQPGLFPLADAAPGRVGQLRAYGNGLDLETAEEFAIAVREIADAL